MTDHAAPTLERWKPGLGDWALTLPLSETGSTLTVTLTGDELLDLGLALAAVAVGKTPTVHVYGYDINLAVDDDGLNIHVTGYDTVSGLAVLPLTAINAITGLIVGAVGR